MYKEVPSGTQIVINFSSGYHTNYVDQFKSGQVWPSDLQQAQDFYNNNTLPKALKLPAPPLEDMMLQFIGERTKAAHDPALHKGATSGYVPTTIYKAGLEAANKFRMKKGLEPFEIGATLRNRQSANGGPFNYQYKNARHGAFSHLILILSFSLSILLVGHLQLGSNPLMDRLRSTGISADEFVLGHPDRLANTTDKSDRQYSRRSVRFRQAGQRGECSVRARAEWNRARIACGLDGHPGSWRLT